MPLLEEQVSGFYNSVNHDRVYTSEDIGKMFDGIIKDGIFQWFGQAFVPLVVEGTNQITIGSGRAWFIKHWIHYETGTVIEIPATDLNLPRWDAVVLYIDNRDDVRSGGIKVVTGTPSSNPTYPNLSDEKIAGVYEEYPICYVYVASNYGLIPSLSSDDLKDMRGTSACPWTYGLNESSNVDVSVNHYTRFRDIPLNKTNFCSIHYTGSDSNAPVTTSYNDWWWNVLTIKAESANRVTQIAFCPFRNRDTLYFRQKHDNTWYGWYSFSVSNITTIQNSISTLTTKTNTNATNITTINGKLSADETILTNLGTRTEIPIPSNSTSISAGGTGAGSWFTITKALSGMSILTASLYHAFSSNNYPTSGSLGFEIEYRASSSASSTVISLRQYAGYHHWDAGKASVCGSTVVSLPENSQIRYVIHNDTNKTMTFSTVQGGNFCRLAHLK